MTQLAKFLPIVLMTLSTMLLGTPAVAQPSLNELARDVDRVESIREVKALQHNYAQYAQYGLWNEVGALFKPDGSFVFDGMVKPAETSTGPEQIATFLRTRYGGGHEGLKSDSLSSMMIDSPVINLAPDGESAKVRWQAIIFHGHAGEARIEGGVFENDYARDGGVWKIATVRYFPQYDGPYEEGWINWGGGDLPVVPKHFDVDSAGIPIPPATSAAPETTETLATLQTRIDTLNDEDRIRNLQSAYGYYADRKMWDDVVDLFANDSVVEIEGQGIWRGPAGVRRWLESIGTAGLTHGQLNDRLQHDVAVAIAPGGNEAYTRGIELGMLGEADQEKGWWEIATFRNRFVREDGVWKIREMRRVVLMKTDIFQGWGKSRIEDPIPTGANAPDETYVVADSPTSEHVMPAFLEMHPVTGKAIAGAGSVKIIATDALTGPIPRGESDAIAIDEARRRLARSAAYDGIENISAAYGYYVDDSDAAGWAGVMAEKGFKQTPFQGYHIGRERLIAARVRGPGPTTQAGISYHWLHQPVVLVSDDGRSATGRFRLFQPRTGKTVGKTGDFFAAQFWGGMYHDRYVLENGAWKIWELTLDEPFITPVSWKDGVWAKAKDPAEPRVYNNTANVDITLKSLGKREENLPGGSGDGRQWPTILPMWFTYTNPVSGRVPELHQPDCVPCALHPELRLDRNGYQEPPDAQDANLFP